MKIPSLSQMFFRHGIALGELGFWSSEGRHQLLPRTTHAELMEGGEAGFIIVSSPHPYPQKCHKDTWNTHQIPKNLSNPLLFALKSAKNRCSSIAISEKLPTFALAFRKGAQNEIFERLRTRRKRQGSAAFREQPSDVNSYRNNKRIKQESLAGQTRASVAAHTYR